MSFDPRGTIPGRPSVQGGGGAITLINPSLVESITPDPPQEQTETIIVIPGAGSVVSRTHIANLAISALGVTQLIANMDTEPTPEAIAAKLHFDNDLNYVLRDFPWPFATAYATLGLVSGTTEAATNYDWQYAYGWPSDCVMVRRIVTAGGRNDTDRPAFSIGRNANGRLIFTDEPDAQIEYTARITDPEQWDEMFIAMLKWRLAAHLAPGLSRVAGMARAAMQMYEIEKSRAHRAALNEAQADPERESIFIEARD